MTKEPVTNQERRDGLAIDLRTNAKFAADLIIDSGASYTEQLELLEDYKDMIGGAIDIQYHVQSAYPDKDEC